MKLQNRRETALILQFPPPEARLRGGRGFQAFSKQTRQVFEISSAACGGASYHEAAIAEANRSRKP